VSTPGLERGTVEVKACALRCLRDRIVALNLNVLLKRFANCVETLLVCHLSRSASQALVIGTRDEGHRPPQGPYCLVSTTSTILAKVTAYTERGLLGRPKAIFLTRIFWTNLDEGRATTSHYPGPRKNGPVAATFERDDKPSGGFQGKNVMLHEAKAFWIFVTFDS
jgi:hypothetical protein